ncbi:MAG: carboxypeptidase-like regulatory domain-containing protein, partial [Flavobacterium sp.]|nr:carboxypeptidase-like regulatory domain-containing protein [Flavobacterium sp.]
KMEPGQKETWSFTVKPKNKKTVPTEILATMYDTSLDQFRKAYWQLSFIPEEYPYYHSYRKTVSPFYTRTFDIRKLNPRQSFRIGNITKDEFNWFGFNINDYKYRLPDSGNTITHKDKIKPKPKKGSKFTVEGVVTENGLPLPGVSIVIKGTTIGTQTDMDGKYTLKVTYNDELVFSFIGMTEVTAKVSEFSTINISMNAGETYLESVVVTAIGVKRKKEGDYSDVGAEELYQTASPNAIKALKGKVSGFQISTSNNTVITGENTIDQNSDALIVIDNIISNYKTLQRLDKAAILSTEILKGAQGAALYGEAGSKGVILITTKKAAEALNNIKARKNLDETAFFFPHLTTDKNGKFSFTFTSPEALTRWKLRLLAHSKKAAIGYYENTIVTQKQLMISPNFPRFFREKDTIFINAKISNLTAESKNGTAVLQLFDAVTMEAIDIPLANTNVYKPFTITPGGNTVVNWKLIIPEGIQAVQYKVLAKSGTFSDGEENIIPVVTNSMLVTESIPLWVREGSTKQYSFENLKNNTSPTLRNHLLTLEYTSNPTWLAIQSLPYLMEYEHECAEQTFARFYGNALATTIINSNPKIAALFDHWRNNGKLSSKLEQNEELKSVLLAETPWLLDAKSEEEKKKNLALLLDLDKMKTSLKETFRKLKNKQASDGGFSWFEGMTRNAYITNHIMAGLGHLEKMKVAPEITSDFEMISETAIPFMDSHFMENHRKRTEKDTKNKKLIWPSPYDELHYLYARSFYLEDYPLSTPVKNTIALYIENCMKNWLTYSLYEKGMAALTLHRFGETKTAKEILLHCKETASNNEDWGMYWIQNKAGWYWYQAPIETQALLIEAFAEINNDTKSVDAMKVWLLKNRQNTNWPSTKATTE